VFGGGDSHCALLGLGCIENGHTGMLLGTNSTLRSVFDRFVSHPEIKLWGQRHVVPDRHTISASSMAGASVVNWFKQSFLPRLSEERFAQIERSAADLPAGADGLTFLPFIHGERCPFLRPDATGAFAGVRAGHKAPHFLRAVIEGIALNIACCFDMIGECAGPLDTDIKEIKLAGGGSRSPLMRQIISDCLNKPIRIMNAEEAGTLGAAMLAGIGSGIYADCREAVAAVVRERETIEPDAVRNVQYAELKSNFTDLCGRIL
jgi:xylulokinase